MIDGSAPFFQDSHPSSSVGSSRSQHLQKFTLADMKRAGAGHQNPAWAKHLEGAQIQLLVAADGSLQNAFGLGKRWRVEDDSVVLLAGGGVVLEQIEGVGLDPFDLAADVGLAVELFVLLGDFQGGTR